MMDLPYEILSQNYVLTLKEKLENVFIKVALVGGDAVGKTCLKNRLINGKFDNKYFMTMEPDQSNFRIRIG